MRSRNSPNRSGNISTAAAPTGASSPARNAPRNMRGLFAAHREGLRRRPLHHARPVGHGVLLRRRHRQSEIHAAGDPGARRARLGRAAAAYLLGSRTAQRAHHRRSRLGEARRHDRLLGRRHGPHPMDAGGVAAHGRRLRPRRPRHALRQAGRFTRRHRALSGRARRISARRGLGLRGQTRRPRGAAAGARYAQWQALGVTPRRRRSPSRGRATG